MPSYSIIHGFEGGVQSDLSLDLRLVSLFWRTIVELPILYILSPTGPKLSFNASITSTSNLISSTNPTLTEIAVVYSSSITKDASPQGARPKAPRSPSLVQGYTTVFYIAPPACRLHLPQRSMDVHLQVPANLPARRPGHTTHPHCHFRVERAPGAWNSHV